MAQRLGAFGPGEVSRLVRHAEGFLAALSPVRGTVFDLGSGGGVPGLVIAVARPDLDVRLLDRSTRRIDALQRMIARLELGARVEAICTDVALYECNEPADAVVARSLAPPAETL
ncbi:MAG: RsmG family class I SAM-dependent methyltransferase, partial [Ilumatobacteraceae bacterium]